MTTKSQNLDQLCSGDGFHVDANRPRFCGMAPLTMCTARTLIFQSHKSTLSMAIQASCLLIRLRTFVPQSK